MKGLIGKKVGMTQVYDEAGVLIPVTVIEAGPCVVTAVKTEECDGYSAVQLGFGSRKAKNVTKACAGHLAKAGVTGDKLPSILREFRAVGEAAVGEVVKADAFAAGEFLDIVGYTKGRGFQGVVKRHGFGGVGQTTHGQDDRLRKPGSIGACSYPAKVFKGMRMGGQMGGDRVTTHNLQVLKVIPEHNLLLIKGSVPGYKGSIVSVLK